MSNVRKLSSFRQLSLTCETPPLEQRRKSLKKQFSEDLPDVKDSWLDSGMGIKISFNIKNKRNLDKPPPVKIAWEDNNNSFKTEDAVIIKKCTEIKRPTTSKLPRQSSLENDSILYTKPKISQIIEPPIQQEPEKPNLNIFLAYNTKESTTSEVLNNKNYEDLDVQNNKVSFKPKIMQPLFATNNKNFFQIRKNTKLKVNLNEIAYSPTTTSKDKYNIKKIEVPDGKEKQDNQNDHIKNELEICNVSAKDITDPKAINNIIIRPLTAASKRDKFQKRTNSAFTSTITENISLARPPLIRSSSAPGKPDQTKSKFLASKRKIKSAKRTPIKSKSFQEDDDNNNKENPKNQKSLNRTASVSGSEIVTMVSLISPDGSDIEEITEEIKDKSKCKSPVKTNTNKEEELTKNLSLRKTVKSVSFQQSSIHAIRSFSASFPARRSSVATSIMLGNNNKPGPHKGNEKRSTNSTASEEEGHAPKKKLLRSQTTRSNSISIESKEDISKNITNTEVVASSELTNNTNISVDIKAKETNIEQETVKEENTFQTVSTREENIEHEIDDDVPKYGSDKEKQCWEMYCRMSEKGINVSYDTLLRGLLTPTEYRMRRKESVTTPVDNC